MRMNSAYDTSTDNITISRKQFWQKESNMVIVSHIIIQMPLCEIADLESLSTFWFTLQISILVADINEAYAILYLS